MNRAAHAARSPGEAIRAFAPVFAGYGEIRDRRRGFSRIPLSLHAGYGTVRRHLLHTASRLDARMIDHLFCPLVTTL
jgi:hypothetical protein